MDKRSLFCWLMAATVFPQMFLAMPLNARAAQNSNKEASESELVEANSANPNSRVMGRRQAVEALKIAQARSNQRNIPDNAVPKTATVPVDNTSEEALFQSQVTVTTKDGKPRTSQPIPPTVPPVHPQLPGRIQGVVPPLQRRPVPPPVGDIAVSNTLLRPDLIDLGSAERVPRISLREAPVRDVLALIARVAGLNVAFADDMSGQTNTAANQSNPADRRISLDIENETAQDVFNNVLRLTGLDANRIGKTIFVAANLPITLKNIVTRSYRLNQVTAGEASAFLVSLGAERAITRQRPIPGAQAAEVGSGGVVVQNIPLEEVPVLESIQRDENSLAPLSGLSVIAEERTNSITLVGTPSQVEYASAQLARLDIRKRQVAINVKIVEINLTESQGFSANSSFGIDNTFVTVRDGTAVLNFGELNAAPATTDGDVFSRPVGNNPLAGTPLFVNPDGTQLTQDPISGEFVPLQQNQPGSPFTDSPTTPGISGITPQRNAVPGNAPRIVVDPTTGQPILDGTNGVPGVPATYYLNPGGVINANLPGLPPALQTGPFGNTPILLDPDTGAPVLATAPVDAQAPQPSFIGQAAQLAYSLPQIFQYPRQFLSRLEASITSGHAKLLTDPTLLVQESETARVDLGDEIIQIDTSGNPVIETAGLSLNINVVRIDDNGFINLSIAPTIASIGDTRNISTDNFAGPVDLLIKRELESGQIRLRDNQTLILTGVIQDVDRQIINKVPFFGDLPILGTLFRSESTENTRNEVVILVTPRILDDSEYASQYGYTYQPGPEVQQVLDSNGIPFR
ncbi:type II and III secretion system protein [Thalassoporum mexicanum PCC 7367]|uniref:secretin N-terminal domain-containing protein n=1 Tax=Thalassoporum mexicanum TaxID=3457544 RepID=UPI00029F886A|nr:secretin N-terminal domain-containing protein [Pseudanabaena sp. PCC 7367]AFY68354.1 type II and III secretion system protein [Pseudanabaena sp. PCC 7367]